MRFLMMWKPSPTNVNRISNKQHMEEMGKFVEESFKSGMLLDTGALLPPSEGACLVSEGGNFTVTDGPYTETKELIGFAIVQAKSKEEAIAHAKRFLAVAGDGETEIRQMMEPPDAAKA